MCDEEITNVKSRLLDILVDLDEEELDSVEQWISSQSYKNELKTKICLKAAEKQLIQIGRALKKLVPFEAELPSEKIVPPTVGDQADCDGTNTCHVDEFLYDEKEVEDLEKQGKIKKYYCLDCKSRNIQPMTYISHSMSRQALQYIYKVLLPGDLSGSTVLDVGSRLGAVLYGAYYFSNAASIIGVEMNKECCDIQDKIIQKFTMDPERIKVINSDVLKTSDLIHSADVIIINVLDFFVDIEKHKQMWYFFKKNIKSGSFLVSNRSMADTLGYLGIYDSLVDWLSIAKINQPENEVFFDLDECSDLYMYTVN